MLSQCWWHLAIFSVCQEGGFTARVCSWTSQDKNSSTPLRAGLGQEWRYCYYLPITCSCTTHAFLVCPQPAPCDSSVSGTREHWFSWKGTGLYNAWIWFLFLKHSDANKDKGLHDPPPIALHHQVRSRLPITHPWFTSTAKSSITSWSFNLLPSGLSMWRLTRALKHSLLGLNCSDLLKQQQLEIMGDHCVPCGKSVGDHALFATLETPTGWSLRLNPNFTKSYKGSGWNLPLKQSFKTLVCDQTFLLRFACITLAVLVLTQCHLSDQNRKARTDTIHSPIHAIIRVNK